MSDCEIEYTFRKQPLGISILLLFMFVFGWFGIHGLQSPRCSSAPWLSYIFYVPPLLIAAGFLVGSINYAGSEIKLMASPACLAITSRWARLFENHEFQSKDIRAISIIPYVSEGVPSADSFYIVIKLWQNNPLLVGDHIEKADAMKLAMALADLYERPLEDHTGEDVDTSGYATFGLFTSMTGRGFRRLIKKQ